MLLPMRKVKVGEEHRHLARFISATGEVTWKHGGKIAIVWLLAAAFSVTQIVQLKFSHDPLNWMPRGMPLVEATQVIDEELSGTMQLDVVFDTGVPNGVKDIEFLKKLAAWQDELDAYNKGIVEVKGTNSLIDIIRESNRALQGGGDEHYRLPDSQSLIIEELFLFENSAADTLYRMVDNDFQTTKMTLVLPWGDMMFYKDFVDEVSAEGTALFDGHADVEVTGMIALMAGTMVKLVFDTAYSYILAAGIIALMMMLLLSSVRLGLLAMIPNIAPIMITMGLMKPLGIDLDMLTILVATIAIGIAVDNTVHFMHHFSHGLDAGHSVHDSIQEAFAGAGQALFTTSIVLSAGFYVFLFSEVSSIFNLGFLCGTAFVLAMVSNFTLTPYLLRWYYRNHKVESNTESQTA
jgi:predicted RND superfamily exporter protein